ncbi:hypothetical protein L7F22_021109 [Adiantum nelumboides]|nr:hypothetical protein [Adiantum nelumboides]
MCVSIQSVVLGHGGPLSWPHTLSQHKVVPYPQTQGRLATSKLSGPCPNFNPIHHFFLLDNVFCCSFDDLHHFCDNKARQLLTQRETDSFLVSDVMLAKEYRQSLCGFPFASTLGGMTPLIDPLYTEIHLHYQRPCGKFLQVHHHPQQSWCSADKDLCKGSCM